MLSQPRLKEILQLLMQSSQYSASDLARQFGVTVRTIRSDIQALNHLMQGAQISLKRGTGYLLEISEPETFDGWKRQALSQNWSLSLNSAEERQRYLLSMLLMETGWQDLDDLADLIYVSRNTVQAYLRSIRNLIGRYELTYESHGIQGIRICGSEENRRECLIKEVLERNLSDYVTDFSAMEKRLFENCDLPALSSIISSELQDSQLTFSDYALKNLTLHSALIIERIQSDNILPDYEKIVFLPEVQEASDKICCSLEEENLIRIPESEREYLSLHIAMNTRMKGIAEVKDLRNAVDQILERIWNVWHFDLRNDEILQKDLYNHLFSIFKAREAKPHYPNPLLNTIRSSFPLAYDISLDAISHVFRLVKLSEDEIGYISLHIGAAVERCYSGKMKPVRIYLVCGSGMAISRMLEARIKSYFQSKLENLGCLSYRQYLSIDQEQLNMADFLITTVPLPDRGIPSVEVDFSLTRNDAESIARLLAPSQKPSEGPERFFQEDLFIRFGEPVSKEQVLDELCSRLIQAGISGPELRESVSEREEISHTNLNEIFAIPHPMAPEAAETRAAVALLDHPVVWNDSTSSVQIVFLLAFCKGEQTSIEHLYDFLLEVVHSVPLQQAILKSENFEEFRKLCLI